MSIPKSIDSPEFQAALDLFASRDYEFRRTDIGQKLAAEAESALIAFIDDYCARQACPGPLEPFAWIVVNDSTGAHDGGEPMTCEDEANDYMENQCLPGWHLEPIYRRIATEPSHSPE